MIFVDIDELTPCLLETASGDIVETESIRIQEVYTYDRTEDEL